MSYSSHWFPEAQINAKGRMHQVRSRGSIGFTIVELLAVIAIIIIVAAIAVPAVSSARDKAASAKCVSNLRRIAAAALMYEADNNGEFPMFYSPDASKIWYNALPQYMGEKAFQTWDTMGAEHPQSCWTCPHQHRKFPGKRTYAINSQLQKASHPNYAPMRRAEYLAINVWEGRMPVTASTMPYFMDGMLFDENDSWREGRRMTMTGQPPKEELFDAWFPHNGGANIVFLDGHVARVGADEPLWADLDRRPVADTGHIAW